MHVINSVCHWLLISDVNRTCAQLLDDPVVLAFVTQPSQPAMWGYFLVSCCLLLSLVNKLLNPILV